MDHSPRCHLWQLQWQLSLRFPWTVLGRNVRAAINPHTRGRLPNHSRTWPALRSLYSTIQAQFSIWRPLPGLLAHQHHTMTASRDICPCLHLPLSTLTSVTSALHVASVLVVSHCTLSAPTKARVPFLTWRLPPSANPNLALHGTYHLPALPAHQRLIMNS